MLRSTLFPTDLERSNDMDAFSGDARRVFKSTPADGSMCDLGSAIATIESA
jgi:hypothetical protein